MRTGLVLGASSAIYVIIWELPAASSRHNKGNRIRTSTTLESNILSVAIIGADKGWLIAATAPQLVVSGAEVQWVLLNMFYFIGLSRFLAFTPHTFHFLLYLFYSLAQSFFMFELHDGEASQLPFRFGFSSPSVCEQSLICLHFY